MRRIIRMQSILQGGGVDVKREENVKELAKLTKGYGGADLRVSATSVWWTVCSADEEDRLCVRRRL